MVLVTPSESVRVIAASGWRLLRTPKVLVWLYSSPAACCKRRRAPQKARSALGCDHPWSHRVFEYAPRGAFAEASVLGEFATLRCSSDGRVSVSCLRGVRSL